MNQHIHDAGTGLAVIAALAATLFVLSYLRVRWYGSEEGRMLMVLGTGFIAVFGFVAARALSGTPTQEPWLEVIRFVVYLYGALITCWLAWLERRANKARPEDSADPA